jgi:hypothetical protein
MAFQIFNDGACIRIENGTKTLLVTKEQVKTIDTVQNNIVRIDIGEGALKNIFINYQDVTSPVVNSGNELREVINSMLLSDQYDGGDATEATQITILQEIQNIKGVTTNLLQNQYQPDFTKLDPIFVDESNPNVIYKGWARTYSSGSAAAWAIQRISRINDIIIYEWADGEQYYTKVWDNRLALTYAHYLSNRINE